MSRVPQDMDWPRDAVFTLGHSTRPLEEFIALLEAYGIRCLADVRTVPRSRHNPQFNSDALSAALRERHISYIALPALGGLRPARKDSINAGWRNQSFRGYADYMQTGEFARGLDDLIALSRETRTAIMCAEAVPWRCHRSLVADALLVRAIPVVEISRQRTTATTSSHPSPMSRAFPSPIRRRHRCSDVGIAGRVNRAKDPASCR